MKRCEKPEDINVPNDQEVIYLETGDTVRRLAGWYSGDVYMLIHVGLGKEVLVNIETGIWWDKYNNGTLNSHDFLGGKNQKVWEKVNCCFTVECE